MIRWSFALLTVLLLGPLSAAQEKKSDEPTKLEKKKAEPGQKPMPDNKPEGPPAGGDAEEAKILERLSQNSKSVEERLGKPDTSPETRKLQDEVLKDIDELIKLLKQPPPPQPPQDQSQNDQSQSGGGGSQSQPMGGGSSSGGQRPMGGGSSGQRSGGMSRQQRQQQREQRRRQQARGGSGRPMGGGRPQPMGGQPGGAAEQLANAGQNAAQQSGAQGQQPMGSAQANSGANAGGGGRDAKGANSAAEMYKDVWGHLPEKMRQEMDSYFKERFMPRYNDLLKQYYSNIAEQNKKK